MLEKEIASLQHSFAEHIESGDSSRTTSSLSSEQLARGVNLQLEEKDLLLENLHREITDLRMSRDAVTCLKNELLASHQAEHEVPVITVFSFHYTSALTNTNRSCYYSGNYPRARKDGFNPTIT